MSAWPVVALGDVARLERGIVLPEDIEDGAAYLGLEHIESGGRIIGSTPVASGDLKSTKFAFTREHVLYGKLRPYLAKIALPSFSGVCSTEIVPIAPGPCMDRGFIAHFLRQPQQVELATALSTGANLPRLSPGELAKLNIPVPPLPEQQRIATILDEADALRAKRRTALAHLDEMARAIFVEMFGDVVTNSKGWDTSRVLDDVSNIASGITKGRKPPAASLRKVPYLAVANVQDHALALDKVKEIEASEDEISRYRLRSGDLVLTEGGDPDKLGRGVLWHDELPECIHQNHIFRVRRTSDALDPVFLNWLIGSRRGKAYFLRSAKQTTGIASINMAQLRAFPLLLPPISVQTAFVKRLAELQLTKVAAQNAARNLDTLFASLQHRAFRGDL